MLDVGANVELHGGNARAVRRDGKIYSRVIHARHPRVGLLSIGEEEHKGNGSRARRLLLSKALPSRFVGNVEGRDLFAGTVDVSCAMDSSGTMALKVSEGLSESSRTCSSSPWPPP